MDIPHAFSQREKIPDSAPRVQLSLKGALKLPVNSNQVH